LATHDRQRSVSFAATINATWRIVMVCRTGACQ
jgi:hypothetical protein